MKSLPSMMFPSSAIYWTCSGFFSFLVSLTLLYPAADRINLSHTRDFVSLTGLIISLGYLQLNHVDFSYVVVAATGHLFWPTTHSSWNVGVTGHSLTNTLGSFLESGHNWSFLSLTLLSLRTGVTGRNWSFLWPLSCSKNNDVSGGYSVQQHGHGVWAWLRWWKLSLRMKTDSGPSHYRSLIRPQSQGMVCLEVVPNSLLMSFYHLHGRESEEEMDFSKLIRKQNQV